MKYAFLKIIIAVFFALILLSFSKVEAEELNNLAKILSGKILLAVESHGEAWYVNPNDLKRYFLNRPIDGLTLMKKLGVGITNQDLTKIPISLITNNNVDSDDDGLYDDLEIAIGTNPNKADSDDDGFNDYTEILNGYNPNGKDKINFDINFAKQCAGKIFLQTQLNGEAWYINPQNNKRYFLGRPIDFFNFMKKMGLGITNENLNKIEAGIFVETPPTQPPIQIENKNVIYAAADAIRSNNTEKLKSYFTENNKILIEYIMSTFDDDQRLTLGNILSGSKLTSSTDNEKVYSNEIYFSLGGYNVPVKFYVEKQSDGTWLMTNL